MEYSTTAAAPFMSLVLSPHDSNAGAGTTFQGVNCQSYASSSSSRSSSSISSGSSSSSCCRGGSSCSSSSSGGPQKRSSPLQMSPKHSARDDAEEHDHQLLGEAESDAELQEYIGGGSGSRDGVVGGRGGKIRQVWQAFMLLLILSLLTTMTMAYGAPGLQSWARDLQASEVRVIVRFDLPADREDLQQQLQQVGRRILQKFALAHQMASS